MKKINMHDCVDANCCAYVSLIFGGDNAESAGAGSNDITPHCCQCSGEFLACEGTEAIHVTKEQECGNVFSEEECTEDCLIQPVTGIAQGCKFMENSHCALYRRGTGIPGEFELFRKCVPGSATPV